MYHNYLPDQEEFSSPCGQNSPPQSEQPKCSPPNQSSPRQGGLIHLLGSLFGGIGTVPGLFQKGGPGKLDKGDILLILVLLYLYWESEDDEWLIILGILFLFG